MDDRENRIVEEAMRQVKARQRRRQGQDALLWIVLWWAGVLVVFFLFPWPLGEKIWAAAHGLCAQSDGHMLCFGAAEGPCSRVLPLCARDSGIYLGTLAGMVYLLARGRWLAAGRLPRWVWIVFAAVGAFFVVDVANSVALDWFQAGVYVPHNALRLASGLLLGMATAVLLLWAINLSFSARRVEQPVLDRWGDLGGLLLVEAAVGAALWSGWTGLYGILTALTMTGMVSMLWAANAMFLLLRTSGSSVLGSVWQAMPSLFWGGVATVFEIALLSWLRTLVGG